MRLFFFLHLLEAGQEDYDRIRPLSYINAHVILLIFAIDAPDAFANIGEKVSNKYINKSWSGDLLLNYHFVKVVWRIK